MKKILISLCAVMICSCTTQKSETALQPIDTKATAQTVALYNNLHKVPSQNGILFGQQDATTMGHIWSSTSNDRSDIKEMCGSHPAIIGADFSGLCSDDSMKVVNAKAALVNQIIGTYKRGGITTICWHMANPVSGENFYWKNSQQEAVKYMLPDSSANAKYKMWLDNMADVMGQIKGDKGELIPIIFRPFHEFDGDWFWWGASHCTTEDFVALWHFTVEYLRDTLGVHNMLYAFSPDCKFDTEEELIARYPGDEYVDIIAFDDYNDFRPHGANDPSLAVMRSKIITSTAAKRNKIAAMSETGLEGVTDSVWYSKVLLPVLKAKGVELSYVVVWRNSNYSTAHHYAPYKGHPAEKDFVEFYKDDFTIFEDRIGDMYN